MTESCETKAKQILEQARSRIKKVAGGNPDDWFKINRYVYTRLQRDERKKEPKKADLFDKQKGFCWICKERIDNIKDTDRHHVDINNVVLVHRSCHQQTQARQT